MTSPDSLTRDDILAESQDTEPTSDQPDGGESASHGISRRTVLGAMAVGAVATACSSGSGAEVTQLADSVSSTSSTLGSTSSTAGPTSSTAPAVVTVQEAEPIVTAAGSTPGVALPTPVSDTVAPAAAAAEAPPATEASAATEAPAAAVTQAPTSTVAQAPATASESASPPALTVDVNPEPAPLGPRIL